ncbi:GNAT family N-acetyltransferase [Sphaerisporangium sp. NPDC005288]|uniref:GNAT family N-acetyltransferase n=1 Tax=Sphaerisporangium sp. NPDC005288 TaxID=3155114 RepID=UPI0033B30A24
MDEVSVRDMTVEDVPAVSAVRVTGWKTAYAGMIPREFLDLMTVEADSEYRRSAFRSDSPVQNLVAERDGTVVGWAALGPCRDEGCTALDGEIYALYALPDAIGTGIGQALMRELLARADRAGFTTLRLWVLEANRRARRFYERAGFHADGGRSLWNIGRTSVPEVSYVRDLLGDSGARPAAG